RLLPGGCDHEGNDQQCAPEQIEPCARIKVFAGAVVVETVYASRESEKPAHTAKQIAGVAGAGNVGAQQKGSGDKGMADEVRHPNFMGKLAGNTGLREIK